LQTDIASCTWYRVRRNCNERAIRHPGRAGDPQRQHEQRMTTSGPIDPHGLDAVAPKPDTVMAALPGVAD
jgi:hypothetical protein